MTTEWFLPNLITQTAEVAQHIAWAGEENGFVYMKNADLSYVSTKKELLHIANPTTNNLKMKTYYLHLEDFNITGLPEVISGIEVEVNMTRGGRITDETVQLRYDGELIGRNSADYKLDNVKVYGAPDDLWELDTLTPEMLLDPSFGVTVRFQSHPSWPHREHPMINFIRLRVS
jgi:hypothetical protein